MAAGEAPGGAGCGAGDPGWVGQWKRFAIGLTLIAKVTKIALTLVAHCHKLG